QFEAADYANTQILLAKQWSPLRKRIWPWFVAAPRKFLEKLPLSRHLSRTWAILNYWLATATKSFVVKASTSIYGWSICFLACILAAWLALPRAYSPAARKTYQPWDVFVQIVMSSLQNQYTTGPMRLDVNDVNAVSVSIAWIVFIMINYILMSLL